MAYLSKETVLNAYKVLSTLNADPLAQGATQRVSTIRYFFALDMFYKTHNRPCDTQDRSDAAEYIENVGKVVAVNDTQYTTNFYYPLKTNSDYAVGSNFYSVNVVHESVANGGTKLTFPRRGTTPIMNVQSGKLYEDKSLIPNIKGFIGTDEHKCALIVWLLRNLNLGNGPFYDEAQKALGTIFTQDLINELLPAANVFNLFCKKIDLTLDASIVKPTDADIKALSEDAEPDKELADDAEPDEKTLQIIYFGTPGSGKSHKVAEIVAGHEAETFRVTFHPDSDYASFVGCYKPITKGSFSLSDTGIDEPSLLDEFMKSSSYKHETKARYLYEGLIHKLDIDRLGLDATTIASKLKTLGFTKCTYTGELNLMFSIFNWLVEEERLKTNSISYEFIPQAFTNAYVKAWQSVTPVYLVIEEINRGNCAQIFGDLFQLLDRDENGYSEYSVKADTDLRNYLESVLGVGHDGIKNGELRLPANLNILATMNTSDQSLFPMDSAFKRRWDWEYVPIEPENPKSQFIITIDDKKYAWKDFLIAANERVKDVSESEDKQMGNFFIKKDIDKDEFVSKVMFYLWSEVCKEEYRARSFFHYKDGNNDEFSFNELFQKDSAGVNKDVALLQGFMNYLGVKEI